MTDQNLFGEQVWLGAPLFVERWSNRKAFRIGLMVGQGMSVPAICEELGDGVTPNLVNGMLSAWQFRLDGDAHTYAEVRVPLSAKHRTKIYRAAKKRSISPDELLQSTLVAIVRDNMWDAVIDE